MDTLMIYASEWPHGEAYICGSKEALQKLRDAIDEALTSSEAIATFSVNDGEGFNLHIFERDESTLDTLVEPYSTRDDAYAGVDPPGPWKWVR